MMTVAASLAQLVVIISAARVHVRVHVLGRHGVLSTSPVWHHTPITSNLASLSTNTARVCAVCTCKCQVNKRYCLLDTSFRNEGFEMCFPVCLQGSWVSGSVCVCVCLCIFLSAGLRVVLPTDQQSWKHHSGLALWEEYQAWECVCVGGKEEEGGFIWPPVRQRVSFPSCVCVSVCSYEVFAGHSGLWGWLKCISVRLVFLWDIYIRGDLRRNSSGSVPGGGTHSRLATQHSPASTLTHHTTIFLIILVHRFPQWKAQFDDLKMAF